MKHDPVHNAVLLQLFLAVLSVTALILAAIIDERAQAEEELRNLSGQLLHLQDQERRKLARELHDSTGQSLAALQMSLGMAQEQARAVNPRTAEMLSEASLLAGNISKEIRTLSYLLHPPLLDEAGLVSAVQWYVEGLAQRSNLKIDLYFPPQLARLSPSLEIVIFRIIQECLTNVHRHSGSTHASIEIVEDGGLILLTVRDTGRGIPPELFDSHGLPRAVGVGIRGMRERVRELGGQLRILPASPGTIIEVQLPMLKREASVPDSPLGQTKPKPIADKRTALKPDWDERHSTLLVYDQSPCSVPAG